jgi:hypothetical protein
MMMTRSYTNLKIGGMQTRSLVTNSESVVKKEKPMKMKLNIFNALNDLMIRNKL